MPSHAMWSGPTFFSKLEYCYLEGGDLGRGAKEKGVVGWNNGVGQGTELLSGETE